MTNSNMTQDGKYNQQAGGDINNIKIEKMVLSVKGIVNKPIKIAKVISQLSKEINTEIPDDYSAIGYYKIEDKITYNNVIKYKEVIDRFGFFGAIIENVCDKLDTDVPNSKSRMFEYIKLLYIQEKSILCNNLSKEEGMEVIRKNADEIIDIVKDKLFELVKQSSILKDIEFEDIEISLVIIITIAFINCKILEKPE
jgi:hypothetical protein